MLWNKLLVMGVALGVSKEVLRQLAEAAWFDDGNPSLRRVNVLALNQMLGQP